MARCKGCKVCLGPNCPFKRKKCTHIQSDDYDEYYDGVLCSTSIPFENDEFADPVELALEDYYTPKEVESLDSRDKALIAFMIIVFVLGNLIGPGLLENVIMPLLSQ